MVHYTACPICHSTSIRPQLTAKDHTVSQSDFVIWHCDSCSARFTQDVPGQEEIGAYYASEDYISHSDTSKGFINNLYHRVRKRTLASKRNLVNRETKMQKGALLDVGCGTGAFLNTMQEAGWKGTGLEPDLKARKKAADLYGLQPLPPETLFNLAPASFQAITMWHVLEHVHELQSYLDQLSKLLAPGGRLFIAVPNFTSYDASVYKEFWAAYDVPRHLYHFSPISMEKLLSLHQMKLVACKPMWFDSFYVALLSEKYKNGKGNLFSAGWTGLISNIKAMGNVRKCSSVIYVIQKVSEGSEPS
ncbi:MAG: class I SAM-dependent methyltransferase [Chitinophagaceae bacterium]|nr:class I SAM-dependent methyltransferase [Chitinophagaceae bacterium]